MSFFSPLTLCFDVSSPAASQFFRDGPSQDEKVANNALDGFDFDAGIHDVSPKPKGKLEWREVVLFLLEAAFFSRAYFSSVAILSAEA